MNKVKRTLSETAARRDDGTVVEERTESVRTDAGAKLTLSNLVWYIFGLIAIILFIRFLLKVFGANPGNGFVDLVYTVSGVFSAPFDTIFGVVKVEGQAVKSVFEPSILVAIAVYGLIAWGIVGLLHINERER